MTRFSDYAAWLKSAPRSKRAAALASPPPQEPCQRSPSGQPIPSGLHRARQRLLRSTPKTRFASALSERAARLPDHRRRVASCVVSLDLVGRR